MEIWKDLGDNRTNVLASSDVRMCALECRPQSSCVLPLISLSKDKHGRIFPPTTRPFRIKSYVYGFSDPHLPNVAANPLPTHIETLRITPFTNKFVMSAAGGTLRNTVNTPNRGQGRGQVPTFENSPSNIPRPKLESHPASTMQSEAGTSTLSASRQKQSKRDEVCIFSLQRLCCYH